MARKSKTAKILTYATAFLAANAVTARADRIQPFPGPNGPGVWNQGIQKEHTVIHPSDEEFWTEGWYFMVEVSEGMYLFNHFAISNAGVGDFSGVVESTIVYPDGKVDFEKQTVSRRDMEYDNKAGTVQFGEAGSLKSVPGKHTVKVSGEKISYSFEVSNQAPGFRPGDGVTYFGSEKDTYYDFTLLAPNGKTKGSVTIDGKQHSINGLTYSDHSHQNHPPHELSQRLYSMRGFNGDNATDLLVFVPPKGEYGDVRIASLVIAKGDKIEFAARNLKTKELGLSADEKIDDYKIPSKIEIENVDGEPQFKGTIAFTKRLQRQDLTEYASFIERTGMKLFGVKPILYRFSADYSIQYETESGQGQSKGNAIVEYMILSDE